MTLTAVSAHLQKLDEGVMLVFGRDVYEAIHQQDADEVTHLLPRRVGQARSWCVHSVLITLRTCSVLCMQTRTLSIYWLSYITSVHNIFFHCILIQCATSMEGTGFLCLTSVISVGKTALARELRKSEEAHRASRGKLLWTKQRNCITLPGYWMSQLSSLPVMGFLKQLKNKRVSNS